jgi:hypothetical protein
LSYEDAANIAGCPIGTIWSRLSRARGETTYRLTNITRGEPAPELFEVPADYQVSDPVNKINRDVVIERKPR